MNDHEIPAAAQTLHQEARTVGGQGDYVASIAKLKQAHELAPKWAYPLYDLAFTYLLQQDFVNALKYYQQTDELEPKGFFTAKTALWTLQKEAAGEFQNGLYLAFMQIEWAQEEAQKIQIAQAIVDRYPDYAPAWKVIAGQGEDFKERLAACENGLRVDPDTETKGMLLINKALILDAQGDRHSANKIINQCLNDPNTTTANLKIAEMVRQNFGEKQ